MDKLKNILNIVIGNTFVMYFRAHTYHWNVECKNFSEMHEFFGKIYEDIHGSLDVMVEELRALDEYAPISITELYKYKTIQEDTEKPASCEDMIKNLLDSNEKMLESLGRLIDSATAAKKHGLVNFVADRIDIHSKHAWMLKSFLKG